MAAPTNVRVESNSQTTATIRWSYAGAAQIAVYRSTDGISYAEVTSAGNRVAVGTLLYIDSTLTAGTKYWYKLTDDAGATFTSVVTVITQVCLPPAGSLDTFSLPRANDTVIPDDFNNLSERIENVLGGRVLAPDDCIVCVTDGAIVLNCGGHCRQFIVISDEDINSISAQYCDEGDGNIDFLIPPNVTRRITGWPNGFGFSGDEPSIVSGANGRTMSVPTSKTGGKGKPTSSKPGTGSGIGSGGGTSSGAACSCTALNGNLTIKSCNANNSLNCSTTKLLKLIACGGRVPYTWSKTGIINLSKTSGQIITVTPPTNAGSGVVGTAYEILCWTCNGANCTAGICAADIMAFRTPYNCDDSWQGAASCSVIGDACSGSTDPGAAALNKCCNGNVNQCSNAVCIDLRAGGCTGVITQCDLRTAPMIAANCNPCGLNNGATVTVTDAVGMQVTIILRS